MKAYTANLVDFNDSRASATNVINVEVLVSVARRDYVINGVVDVDIIRGHPRGQGRGRGRVIKRSNDKWHYNAIWRTMSETLICDVSVS